MHVLWMLQGFALDRQVERSAVLRCLAVFLDALEILADGQGGGVAQPATNSMATLSVEEVQPGHGELENGSSSTRCSNCTL